MMSFIFSQISFAARAETRFSGLELARLELIITQGPQFLGTYLEVLRQAVIEIEDQQKGQAQFNDRPFGSREQLIGAFRFIAQVNNAFAEDGEVCLYAGNFSTRNESGKCQRPANDPCGSGSIQCNPLLFGPEICVAGGNRATINCMSSISNDEKLIQYLKKHQKEWDELSKRLNAHCDQNLESQMGVCGSLQRRLIALNHSLKPSGKVRPKNIANSSIDKAPITKSKPASASVAKPQKARCSVEDLFIDVRCQPRGKVQLLVEPAAIQSFMCDGATLTEGFFEKTREDLQKAQNCLEENKKVNSELSKIELGAKRSDGNKDSQITVGLGIFKYQRRLKVKELDLVIWQQSLKDGIPKALAALKECEKQGPRTEQVFSKRRLKDLGTLWSVNYSETQEEAALENRHAQSFVYSQRKEYSPDFFKANYAKLCELRIDSPSKAQQPAVLEPAPIEFDYDAIQ